MTEINSIVYNALADVMFEMDVLAGKKVSKEEMKEALDFFMDKFFEDETEEVAEELVDEDEDEDFAEKLEEANEFWKKAEDRIDRVAFHSDSECRDAYEFLIECNDFDFDSFMLDLYDNGNRIPTDKEIVDAIKEVAEELC